ncbi:DUF1292 domain-containing protein [Cohnella endophytica]|uniref:DUF1292 domain-containing protein n=1 Tax=Cohnella endophytica TaxID=2419778 RepID=A0A494Y1A3_9BACL|nr:DUF1292 domain-containing protein [Cohnella endophytica]RKP55143.1 DUF1292 domain-containing protein [Cohnella endophytica]
MSNNKESELRHLFGDTVELTTEDGASLTFRILSELEVGEGRYAVLQSKEMQQEGEIEIFRIVSDSDGEPQLESVTDEDEWELVAETYDDSQFGSDERP